MHANRSYGTVDFLIARSPKSIVLFLAVVLTLYLAAEWATPAKADGEAQEQTYRDVAIAVRTEQSIELDGVIDDVAWQTAQPLATMSDRFMARPPARSTVFKLCYDEHSWYVGVVCDLPDADKVYVGAKTRDSDSCACSARRRNCHPR